MAATAEEVDYLLSHGMISPQIAAALKSGAQQEPRKFGRTADLIQPTGLPRSFATKIADMTAPKPTPAPGGLPVNFTSKDAAAAMAAPGTKWTPEKVAAVGYEQQVAADAVARKAGGRPAEMMPEGVGRGGEKPIPESEMVPPIEKPDVAPEPEATKSEPINASTTVGGGKVIDPALVDALHSSGEISAETAAKLHKANGSTSNIAESKGGGV